MVTPHIRDIPQTWFKTQSHLLRSKPKLSDLHDAPKFESQRNLFKTKQKGPDESFSSSSPKSTYLDPDLSPIKRPKKMTAASSIGQNQEESKMEPKLVPRS